VFRCTGRSGLELVIWTLRYRTLLHNPVSVAPVGCNK